MRKAKANDTSEELLKTNVLDLRDSLITVKDKIGFLIDCFCQDGTPFALSETGQTGLYHVLDEMADEIVRIENELGVMQMQHKEKGKQWVKKVKKEGRS